MFSVGLVVVVLFCWVMVWDAEPIFSLMSLISVLRVEISPLRFEITVDEYAREPTRASVRISIATKGVFCTPVYCR